MALSGALDFDRNSGGGIQNEARQSQRSCEVVDEGAKADPLHHSPDRDALANSRKRAGCGHGMVLGCASGRAGRPI